MQPAEPSFPQSPSVDPDLRLVLEKLLSRGREAFQSDGVLPIEQLVAEAPAEYQDLVFVQLLIDEMQLRSSRGLTTTLDDYRHRFPTRVELVEKAWRRHQPHESPSTVDQQHDPSDALATRLQPVTAATPEEPMRFGPYKVLLTLGAGTFGSVYKAQHETTGDVVAVKMLKTQWARDPECGEAMRQQFAEEAKMMLKFDHPHVVKVISLDDQADPPFFVQEFIDGETLASRLNDSRPALEDTLRYAIEIADGLSYIHSRELWHRDLKPGNILLDRNNKVYIADFGLALDDAQRWRTARSPAGTFPYMAPEQIKGATHRLNARCDIWALGVIMYEMLTGRQPFRGETREQLCDEIIERTPAAPRELQPSIPQALNHLCMKCLSKRDSDRPHAAIDLRDELVQIGKRLQQASPPSTSSSSSPQSTGSAKSTAPVSPKTVEYPIPTLKRFTAEQVELYLRLMPRSYANKDELPELIAYWKERILERDPDKTFTVGIMVGVSGCGKSSMLEAGLVPALPESIIPILIEASESDTEVRILNKLRRAIPDADPEKKWSLVDWAFRLRSGSLLPPDKKVVFILDQFEQWLNAHGGETTNQLLDALHQCDGEHLQGIVCVREGFHATLMRFVESLELVLDADANYATAHRFKPDHARYVLMQFGRGLKRLDDPITETQQAFIDSTVEGLAESDRGVVCVRLVVLALVMQDRPWTVDELNSLGGLDGIGAQFLTDCFEGRTASEQYRRYLPAAMRVLAELLPTEGLEIKDVRSYDQLLAASELDKLQFDDLLNILTRKLFLLTLVEADTAPSELATRHAPLATRHYQLTHDFLVPSIREWLARKLRETKEGRALLRLQERTSAWTSKPENRNLPSLWEWITIRRLTDRQKWKPNEQTVMRRAGRMHAIRSGLLTTFAIALLVVGFGVKRWNDARLLDRDATNLVSSIESADYAKLPELIAQLDPMRSVAVPKLQQALNRHDPESDERLKLSLGLLGSDPGQVDYLLQRLLGAEARQVPLLVQQLEPHAAQVLPQLWTAAKELESKSLLQAASALAAYDPSNENWQSIAGLTAAQVVRENPLRLATWIETLRPVASELNPQLKEICIAEADTRSQTEIDLATDLLETYAAEDFEILHELILAGGPSQFSRFFPLYSRFGSEAIERLRRELARPFEPNGSESAEEIGQEDEELLRLAYIARQANAAVALLRLENPTPVYEFLTVDRDLEALSQFIYRIRGREVSPLLLIKSFEELRSKPALADPLQQRRHLNRLYGFLLGLGEFLYDELPAQQRDALVEELAAMYATHPSRAIHSALGWLLRRWGQDERVRQVDETPLDYDETGQREWFVLKIDPPPSESLEEVSEDEDSLKPVVDLSAPIYFTMIVFPGGEFAMGEPEDSELVEVAGPIAVSDREVTWRQFSAIDGDTHRRNWVLQFKKELSGRELLPDEPVFGVNWFEAVNYCRWLTSAGGFEEESQSYSKLNLPEGAADDPGWLKLPVNTEWPLRLDRPGFRLPTEAEWEYVARAGTETSYSFGESEELLGEYCWHDENSNAGAHRTGLQRPSVGGLFDIHGNLSEWVDDWYARGSVRVGRSGGWDAVARSCSTANRSSLPPSVRTRNIGFRLALSPFGGPSPLVSAAGEAEPFGVGTEGVAEQRPVMP